MTQLKPVSRYALKRKIFKNLIQQYMSGTIEWKDPLLKPLKDLIRSLQRHEQKEICPYCQRIIIPERRNVTEHIEHFLDKSRDGYKKFAFTASNLVLACQACNIEKGTKNLLPSGRAIPTYLRASETPFLWPHPYFDDILTCVKKDHGPVYSAVVGSPRQAEAQNMIIDLKLNDIQNKESRYYKLIFKRDRLMNIIIKIAERNMNGKRSGIRLESVKQELFRVNYELS
ncbi:MAG: hypothetical protein ABF553_00590 [Acetobacter orientalis]|uniref:hypothetical protein n=1 Tax=Acetobacter orientalis TaxID=146474 RepID=UPI0039ED8AEE